MTTLGQLGRTVRDVEASMPPHLLALHRASETVRAAYAAHRAALRDWYGRQGPNVYVRWLDGEIEPPTLPALLHSIFPPMQPPCVGDDLADLWRHALENGR